MNKKNVVSRCKQKRRMLVNAISSSVRWWCGQKALFEKVGGRREKGDEEDKYKVKENEKKKQDFERAFDPK